MAILVAWPLANFYNSTVNVYTANLPAKRSGAFGNRCETTSRLLFSALDFCHAPRAERHGPAPVSGKCHASDIAKCSWAMSLSCPLLQSRGQRHPREDIAGKSEKTHALIAFVEGTRFFTCRTSGDILGFIRRCRQVDSEISFC